MQHTDISGETNLEYRLYTASQTRAIDKTAISQQFNNDGFVLMHRAGESAFARITELYPDTKSLVIFCGQGNNGGDGFVIAALAAEKNYNTKVIFLGENSKLSAESDRAYSDYTKFSNTDSNKHNLFICNSEKELANAIKIIDDETNNLSDNHSLYIDSLLGTGLNKAPSGIYKTAIEFINSKPNIFAIDIPSGLAADTGFAYTPAIKANATISFIAQKQGLFTGDGLDCCGDLYFTGLEVSNDILQAAEYSSWLLNDSWVNTVINKYLPKRTKNSHKHQYGHVVIIGGDAGMPGAVTMAGAAALRTGAGLVSVVTNNEHSAEIAQHQPELMVHGVTSLFDAVKLTELFAKANVILLGPGLGLSDWSRNLFKFSLDYIINNQSNLESVIIDADGLTLLSEHKQQLDFISDDKLILTPHPGEAKKLLYNSLNISEDRYKAVDNITNNYNAITVLKGAGTLVSSSNSKTAVCKFGNPGMASAGMGDILAGIIASLTAQGVESYSATCLAVYMHAKSGDLQADKYGERGLIATDILQEIRSLLNE